MEISNIIYYTRQNEKSRTLSLRDLCLKGENKGLENIFYIVKDSINIQDFLYRFHELFYESIALESEESSYIRFKVIDAYANTNYLKLKKQKTMNTEA